LVKAQKDWKRANLKMAPKEILFRQNAKDDYAIMNISFEVA